MRPVSDGALDVVRRVAAACLVAGGAVGFAAAGTEPPGAYAAFPVLRGPWLGQDPPGDEAAVLLPGVLKPPGGYHSAVVFAPGGAEACWTAMGSGVTFMSRLRDGVWSRPEALSWDREFGVREPFYSRDGNRVYFLSRRPPPGEVVERERIWFVERRAEGWSPPRPIGRTVSSHPTHWSFSFSASGNLYFTSEVAGVRGEQDIYVAPGSPQGLRTPRDLGPAVNSDVRDFCPFVAPDESYLVFARSVPAQRGRSDLFVSFRTADGAWTPAQNLGPAVNTPHNEVAPVVTPDGLALVFARVSAEVNDVYWVSTRVIERLRPCR